MTRRNAANGARTVRQIEGLCAQFTRRGLSRGIRTFRVGALATLIGAMGCRARDRSGGTHADSDHASSPGMAGTPGMSEAPGGHGSEAPGESDALPAEVTFSAAQVLHGGVRWGPAPAGEAAETAIVPGQIAPNEDRTARLGAPARGRVMAVRVRPGDPVVAGQVLVTLESPDAASAQADATKAAADLASRKAEEVYAASARARAERLLALKAIPQQDYERAVADDELARGALADALAEERRARATAEHLGAALWSGSASGQIEIRAPFSGVTLARTAAPGTVVDAGAPLVVVTDPTRLWLTASVPEQLAGLFRLGATLRFTVPAYPADTFTARTDAVGAGLDPDTRTLPVRGAIANASDRLKPAMLASVLVEGAREAAAVVLPEDAVQLVAGTPTVFVATPDGKGGERFARRAVELGPRWGGRIAVTRGLAPGDVVVIAGAFAVKAQLEKAAAPDMEM